MISLVSTLCSAEVYSHTQCFTRGLGFKLGSSCLQSEHFYSPSHLPRPLLNLQIVLPSSVILCFPTEHLDFFSSEGCLSLHPLQSLLCGRETHDTCGLESTPLLSFAYTSCFVLTLSIVKITLLWCNVYGTKNGKLVLYVFLELGVPPFWRVWCVGEEWLCHRCAACTPGSPLHCYELRRTNTLATDEKCCEHRSTLQ